MTKRRVYYKLLSDNALAIFAHFNYKPFLPRAKKPGKWLPAVKGQLEMCNNGYHVATGRRGLEYWWEHGFRVFRVETSGAVELGYDKAVCRRIRLVKELTPSQISRAMGHR